MCVIADFDAQGWVLIITAILGGIAGIVKLVLDFFRDRARDQRDRDRDQRDKVTAQNIVEVKSDAKTARLLAGTAAEVSISTDEKAERIERQTNGITDTLRQELDRVTKLLAAEQQAHAETRAIADAALLHVPAQAVGELAEKMVASKSDTFKPPATTETAEHTPLSATDTVKET